MSLPHESEITHTMPWPLLNDIVHDSFKQGHEEKTNKLRALFEGRIDGLDEESMRFDLIFSSSSQRKQTDPQSVPAKYRLIRCYHLRYTNRPLAVGEEDDWLLKLPPVRPATGKLLAWDNRFIHLSPVFPTPN
jgi:hypothetical protein